MSLSELDAIERDLYEALQDGEQIYDRVLAEWIITNGRAWYSTEDVINVLRDMIRKGYVEVTSAMHDAEGRSLCKYKANYTL